MYYYINNNPQSDSGDNEVHEASCSWLSLVKDKTFLGDFNNCRDAIAEAKRRGYSRADGCVHCSKPCHRS